LEEFGRTMQSFKAANKKQYEATVTALSTLMRVSRKTGLYFLLIDQSMAGWDQLIKPNIKDYISYHLGGNQGNAFNAYNLHELKPKGQFWNNRSVYNAWYTRGEAKTLLQELQPSHTKLLTNVEYSTINDASDASIVKRGESKRKKQADLHPLRDASIDVTSPVSDASIDVSPTNDVSIDVNDASITKPPLIGKPVSKKDVELVRNTYALSGSINETCRLLWGGRTESRKKWVKEIIGESGQ